MYICVCVEREKESNRATLWLVERPTAGSSAAVAGDLFLLQGKLVVIGDLVTSAYVLERVDDNLGPAVKRNHAGGAVRLCS